VPSSGYHVVLLSACTSQKRFQKFLPDHLPSKQFFRVFCVTCGFVITKVDLFPTVAARGAGQIVLNITIPCLMFSKIVPAFSPDNVQALGTFPTIFITKHNLILSIGPLVLIAILYEAIGILCAWIIKQFFWVPHQFRYGILVAGGWANVGDIREFHILMLIIFPGLILRAQRPRSL
jgi:predicted permease